MHRHGRKASAEHADHVVLEPLNGLLGKVAMMVIGRDKFACHLGEFNLGLVHKKILVVEYLMQWNDATLGHLRKCAMAGKNEFALIIVLEGLASGGVGAHMVEDHDVAVAKAGDERGMTCLAFVHCVL